MMKKISWLSFMAVFLTMFSCRNDVFPELNQQHYNNASKFRILNLNHLPEVKNIILEESGRRDLIVPLSGIGNVLGKASTTFGEIDPSLVVEKNTGNEVYYTLKIENPSSTDVFYNLEIKKEAGMTAKVQIIKYDPQDGIPVDLEHFTGKISSYKLSGEPISSVDYSGGSSGCPPFIGDNPDMGPGGGGLDPGDNPSFPDPGSGYPEWPDFPDPGVGNGGSGDDNNTEQPIDVGCGPWQALYDNAGNITGMTNGCQIIIYSGKMESMLTPECENGSGVTIAPNTPPQTPCEKIKNKFTDPAFKAKVAAIDKPEVFDYDHEMGFAAGYPPPNTGVTGTQYPPMENSLGTHSVRLPDGDNYFGYIHSHNNESSGGIPIKIFSPYDVITFLTSCVRNADEHGSIEDAYCMVITSEGNYMLQYSGTGDFGIGPNQIENWKTWYKNNAENILKEDGTFEQADVEKLFANFLSKSVKINGLEVYHIEKTTGKASKINTDGTKIPCPN